MKKKKTLIIAAVAAAALTAVILLLIFLPKNGSDSSASTIDEGIDMARSVDKDGMHQVEIKTDKDGNISNNSYGTLMEYYPANIRRIHVENSKGTFDVEAVTPEGEATEYTLKGYEDFNLQAGNPDQIANVAASLKFVKVTTLDKNKGGEFGFDKPRSTVTVTYDDNTRAVIIVGDDAPQQAGTYIKFGTGDAVYLVEPGVVSAFDFGVNDLISLTINDAADSTDNNQPESVKISGAAFSKEIEFVPNENENFSASYQMTAPVSRLASESESSLVTGGIRGLYAEEVKLVNPSESQLAELGLSKPHAVLTAVYPDTTVKLLAAKPDKEGKVLLMTDGGKVVYSIAADKVSWASTSYDKLCGEYACNPKMSKLTEMTVKANGKTYEFKLKTSQSLKTDDQGSETSVETTTATLDGKEIEAGAFNDFYNNIALIPMADAKTDGSGKTVLEVTYTFGDGSSDTVTFEETDGKYLVKLNGEAMGHCNKGDITRALNSVAEVVK